MTPRVTISYLRKSIVLKESRTHLHKNFGYVKNLLTHTRSPKLLCPSHDKLSPKHSPHSRIIHQLLQAAYNCLACSWRWEQPLRADARAFWRQRVSACQAGDADDPPCQGNRTSLQEAIFCGTCQCVEYSSRLHAEGFHGAAIQMVSASTPCPWNLRKRGSHLGNGTRLGRRGIAGSCAAQPPNRQLSDFYMGVGRRRLKGPAERARPPARSVHPYQRASVVNHIRAGRVRADVRHPRPIPGTCGWHLHRQQAEPSPRKGPVSWPRARSFLWEWAEAPELALGGDEATRGEAGGQRCCLLLIFSSCTAGNYGWREG